MLWSRRVYLVLFPEVAKQMRRSGQHVVGQGVCHRARRSSSERSRLVTKPDPTESTTMAKTMGMWAWRSMDWREQGLEWVKMEPSSASRS
jgi:hypothetical protein